MLPFLIPLTVFHWPRIRGPVKVGPNRVQTQAYAIRTALLSACAASLALAFQPQLVMTASPSQPAIGRRVIEEPGTQLVLLFDEGSGMISALLFGHDASVAESWAALPGVAQIRPWVPQVGLVTTTGGRPPSGDLQHVLLLGLGADPAELPGSAVAGRFFSEDEVRNGAQLALVSTSLARRCGFAPGKEQGIIGRTVSASFGEGQPWIDLEVIGVYTAPGSAGGGGESGSDDRLSVLLALWEEVSSLLIMEGLAPEVNGTYPDLILPYTLLAASVSPAFQSYLIEVEPGRLPTVLGRLWVGRVGRTQADSDSIPGEGGAPVDARTQGKGWLTWVSNLRPVTGFLLVLFLVLVVPFVTGYAFWGLVRRLLRRLDRRTGVLGTVWDLLPLLVGVVLVAVVLLVLRSSLLGPVQEPLGEPLNGITKVVAEFADDFARALPLGRVLLVTVGLMALAIAIPALVSYLRHLRTEDHNQQTRQFPSRPHTTDLPGEFSRWRWIWRRVTFAPLEAMVLVLTAAVGGAALTLSWPTVRGSDPYSTTLTELSPAARRTITIRPRLSDYGPYALPQPVRFADETVRPLTVRDLHLFEEVDGVEAALAETVVSDAKVLAIRDDRAQDKGEYGRSVEPIPVRVVRVTPSWFAGSQGKAANFVAGSTWVKEDLERIPALAPGWMYFSTINEWVAVGGTGAAILVVNDPSSRPAFEMGDEIMIRGRLGNGSAALPYSLSQEDERLIADLPIKSGDHVGWYRIAGVMTPSPESDLPGLRAGGMVGREDTNLVLLLPLYDWDEVTDVDVVAQPGVSVAALSAYLAYLVSREWGEGRFEVVATVDNLQRQAAPWRALRQRALFLTIFTLVLACLATLAVYLLRTHRRLSQIAMAKALGASRLEIARDIVAELLTVGAVGALPAATAAWVLAPLVFRWAGLTVTARQLPGLAAILAGAGSIMLVLLVAGVLIASLALRSEPVRLLHER